MFLKKFLLTFMAASVMSFAGTVTDRNRNEYQTVSIEGFGQEWMAEDLLVGSVSKVDWTTAMNISSGYLNVFYGNGSQVQGVCPEGWRLPSAQEWESLLNHFISGTEDCGYDGCNSKSWNSYVFSNSGLDFPSKGFYWTSTQTMDLDGAQRYANGVKIDGPLISLDRLVSKNAKLRIRCIRDVEESDYDDYSENGSSQEDEFENYETEGSFSSVSYVQALGLSVAITDEYMVIGARGGFQPNVYYQAVPSRNGTRYVAIRKESENDPGRMLWGLYSSKNGSPDSVYLDGAGNFFMGVGEGAEGRREPVLKKLVSTGKIVGTLAPNSKRYLSTREYDEAIVAPLSAFDVIAKDLNEIHSQFIDLADVDDVILVMNADDVSKDALLKRLRTYRPLVQIMKSIGFSHIELALLGEAYFRFVRGGENASQADMMDFWREIYEALGVRMPSKEEIDRRRRYKAGGGGKPRGKGQPNAPQTRPVIKLLTAQTKNASAGAYDLMKNQKFSKDIDEVLKDIVARGKARRDSCEAIGDTTAECAGIAAKGSVKTPSERDIDMVAGGGPRSAADIMKVVRQRTPGLRHIYNKFLKKKPGFQGKVTLRFTIAPGGEVISISIASSTTGFGEFDGEVKTAVSRWKFSRVKSGNTTVTIPFAFSE